VASDLQPRLRIGPKELTCTFSEADKLGGGTFGIVYKGKWKGHPVAVKVVAEGKRSQADLNELYDDVLKEVEPLVLYLKHPNVIKFLGICSHRTYGPIIVTELCEAGPLQAYLETGKPLPADLRDKFIKQICEGVQAFHNFDIVHRDLKPDNILVTKELIIRITDFGLVIDLSKTAMSVQGAAGTWLYMPPEALKTNAKLTTKADMWAVGVIICQLHGVSMDELMEKVVNYREAPEIPNSVPAKAKGVIKSCFARNPADRPTAKQILDSLGISDIPGTHEGTPAIEQGTGAATQSRKGPMGWLLGSFKRQAAVSHSPTGASSTNVSAVGHSSSVHMSTANTTTGPPSSVAKTSQPPPQHIAPPAQQPYVKTPESAPPPQIKHTDIFEAVKAADEQSVRLLIERDGKDILDKRERDKYNFEFTPFLKAAQKGEVGVMSVMYASKPDVLQQTTVRGDTAIHRAAVRGHGAAVSRLLEWDPKLIDARDNLGEHTHVFDASVSRLCVYVC